MGTDNKRRTPAARNNTHRTSNQQQPQPGNPQGNPTAVPAAVTAGNKRPREFSYQENAAQQNSAVMPNYMGYFPPGVAVGQSMYQQMPSSSDVPMSLPPLYVGPAMGLPVHPSQTNGEAQNGTEQPAPKKKHTSAWALEKRRARNRVTAAESRRKSKAEAQMLRDEVARLGGEIKSKTDQLNEYKEKYSLYENGQSKEDIERAVSQRRAAMAAADAVVTAANEATQPGPTPPSRPILMEQNNGSNQLRPVVEMPPVGETAEL